MHTPGKISRRRYTRRGSWIIQGWCRGKARDLTRWRPLKRRFSELIGSCENVCAWFGGRRCQNFRARSGGCWRVICFESDRGYRPPRFVLLVVALLCREIFMLCVKLPCTYCGWFASFIRGVKKATCHMVRG